MAGIQTLSVSRGKLSEGGAASSLNGGFTAGGGIAWRICKAECWEGQYSISESYKDRIQKSRYEDRAQCSNTLRLGLTTASQWCRFVVVSLIHQDNGNLHLFKMRHIGEWHFQSSLCTMKVSKFLAPTVGYSRYHSNLVLGSIQQWNRYTLRQTWGKNNPVAWGHGSVCQIESSFWGWTSWCARS